MNDNRVLLPSLAVATSGALWGLYWIPIRELHAQGMPPYWTNLFSFCIVGAVAFAMLVTQWRRSGKFPGTVILIGLITGVSVILYATSLVLTDVIKTLLLFYLMPVWGTLFGRVMLKERITRTRLLAVTLGLAGLAVILDVHLGFPKPSNLGDWFALLSGLLWAYASTRIRQEKDITAGEQVCGFYVGGGVVAIAACFTPASVFGQIPDIATIGASFGWLIVFIVAFVPTVYLIFWGTQRLSPTRVGILLMTEVVFGITSAAWLSGEQFGWLRFLGVILIVGAAVVELAAAPQVVGKKEAELA